MQVTYRIKDELPARSATGIFAVGLDVVVSRQSDIGDKEMRYHITDLTSAGTTATAILAWIAADVAALATQLGIITTNQALKAAFELAVGELTVTVTV